MRYSISDTPIQIMNSCYDKVAKIVVAQKLLPKYGDSLDFEEGIIDKLFKLTRNMIYGDNKSTSIS